MKKRRFTQAVIVLAGCLFIGLTTLTASAQTPAYGWHNVQIVGGGFTTGIIYNQTEPNLVYIRTDMGGAYRLNPVTNRWIPLLDWVNWDNWNLTGVESLATDPVDPNRLYIAAGTYTNSWAGNGAILCSANRGKTFQISNLSFKLGGNMPGRSMGERLAVDPHKNSILYFGARSGNGLWRSADYGATWSRDTNFTAVGTYTSGGDIIGVVWVTFDNSGTAGNPTQTIYVGVANTTGNTIYRSTNGGATWAAIPGQPTGYLPHHGVLASNGILYITYSNTCGPFDGSQGDVWKFNTSSGVWTQISPIPSSSSDDNFGYAGLAVDAQYPNTIMVTSMELWWPDDIIFRSTDGGVTWKRIWEIGVYPERINYYTQDISFAPWLDWGVTKALPEISPKLGWMIGDIKIDPFNSNKMRYVTGATIYGSDNLTAWDTGGIVSLSVKAQGQEQTAVQDVISPPAGAHLLSAVGDLGGFRHADLNTVPARMCMPPSFSTGTSLDFAELDCNYIVRVGNGSTIHYGWSNDNGVTWTQAVTEPAGTSGGGIIALSANAGKVVWAPSGASVSYSTNINGTTWSTSTGIPAGARVISDRVNSNKFYGFISGTFYVSTNGGASFSATAATGLPSSGIIKAMPGIEGDIWLAGGSGSTYGVWHSTNSGTSFTKLSGIQEADNIGFGKAAPGQSYMALYISAQIGGIRGIYRSIDAGANWVRINDDLHQFAYTGPTITGDPRIFGRVYFCTNGRGIIYGDFYGDFTGDGVVNIYDLYEFCENWWLENDPVKTLGVDLDNDGIINFYEFSVFAQNWSGQ
ncbi:MAG: xyloglucanase [Sedimentisphaerales bacterium]